MKIFRGMILFFVLTIISGGLAIGLQSTTAYRTYAISLFIGLISLFLSFILAIISLKKDEHRGLTIFILICSGIGIIFVIIVLVFILFFLNSVS